MRTTLTLEPDVVQLLKDAAHRQHKSFKAVVNESIRRGLGPQAPRGKLPPYRVEPHKTTLCAGIDPGHLNELADELENEALLGRGGRR